MNIDNGFGAACDASYVAFFTEKDIDPIFWLASKKKTWYNKLNLKAFKLSFS